jgi:DNA-binding transcriptional MerR regulator
MTGDEEPIYNIGAVARLTGITEATLRAWERRYDFPRTARTAGHHRLYALREVRRIQWVQLRIAEGMPPRLAIAALNRAEATTAPQPIALPAPTLQVTSSLTLATFQQRLQQALFAYEHETAAIILAEAQTHYSIETVALDLIGPVLFNIGEAWSTGAIDVALEHFATGVLRDHLRAAMHTTSADAPVRPVGLACAPGELHEGSLLILGVLLGHLRWPVLYLGQSFPLTDLAALATHARPSILVFVAMSESTALALADWPHFLPPGGDAPLVGFGGRAFTEHPDLVARVPGLYLGASLHEGSATLHRLLLDLVPPAG